VADLIPAHRGPALTRQTSTDSPSPAKVPDEVSAATVPLTFQDLYSTCLTGHTGVTYMAECQVSHFMQGVGTHVDSQSFRFRSSMAALSIISA
jgi:hypothetical protein